MKEIKLFNRDNANLCLISEDNKTWKFKVDANHEYILKYMRIGYNDNNIIDMIDPSGGPYLSIGQRLDKTHIIKSIIEQNNELIIITEEKEV